MLPQTDDSGSVETGNERGVEESVPRDIRAILYDDGEQICDDEYWSADLPEAGWGRP